MLHLSLFLFFAGVIAFLWTLDMTIGIWIIVLGALLAVFYIGCTLVPLWIPQCPTSTPLVHHIRRGIISLQLVFLRARLASLPLVAEARGLLMPRFFTRQRESASARASQDVSILPIHVSPSSVHLESSEALARLEGAIEWSIARRRDRSGIAGHIDVLEDDLDRSALRWLMFDVSDSDAVAVGVQALGVLHPSSKVAEAIRTFDVPLGVALGRSSSGAGLADAVRAQRSALCMRRERSNEWHWYGGVFEILAKSCFPDALALNYNLPFVIHPDDQPSRSSTSTAVHVIRSTELSLENLLRYLLLCDFDFFTDADWDIVLDTFSTQDELYLCRLRPKKELDILPRLCLGDLLAQIFSGLSDAIIRRDVARIIYRLIYHRHYFLANWHLGPQPLLASPFLLRFLSSDVPEHRRDEGSLHTVLGLLRLGSVVLTRADCTAQKLWLAVARALHDALKIEHPPLALPSDLWPPSIYTKACTSSSDERSVFDTVMEPFPAPEIGPSIWSMSRSFGSDFPEGLGLADDLAAALCLRMRHSGRTPETLHYIELFFAKMDPGDVVFGMSRWTWDQRHKAFDSTSRYEETLAVHLTQHCYELRPEWWFDVLAYSQASASEDERQMVLRLDTELAHRGPCIECPRELGYGVFSPRLTPIVVRA